jgi:hypothetical protein
MGSTSTNDIEKPTPTRDLRAELFQDLSTGFEVRFEHDNVWLMQKLMAELYECLSDNISLNLKNILKRGSCR